MSQPSNPISPAEQLKKDFASVQREIKDLHSKVNLSSIYDKIEDLQTKINGLMNRINELRIKNYVFDTTLESTAQDFQKRWQPIQSNLKVKLNQEMFQLKSNMKPIEVQQIKVTSNINNVAYSRQTLKSLEVLVENLSKKVSASESLLRGMYDSFERELNQFNKKLLDIEWTVKEFETSNIKLFPHEFLILCVKSVWTRDGKKDKDDPEGILFLTDQRIIFEQKQEVATKKFLFITRERELLQNVLVDIPIKFVESIQTAKQGIFKNQDYLDLTFASGAQYNNAQFHLQNQDCEDWKGLINNVHSGEYDKNRTEQVDQEILDKIRNAPTICPQCSATISVQIIRGMDQFSCEFCGAIIKL